MQVGDWASLCFTDDEGREEEGTVLISCLYEGGDADILRCLCGHIVQWTVNMCELEPTTPTPEELAQWREALAKVGLALAPKERGEL